MKTGLLVKKGSSEITRIFPARAAFAEEGGFTQAQLPPVPSFHFPPDAA